VGAVALSRFVRPVVFQSVLDSALPAGVGSAVAPENPWRILRRVNGSTHNPVTEAAADSMPLPDTSQDDLPQVGRSIGREWTCHT
jgi:hypothetical protein